MEPLRKSTLTYAHHDVPLQCDIYDAADYADDSPVLLFFHSGGLVGGGRIFIPPWLVQTCYSWKWPLISASYRFLPQIGGKALYEDAAAAYTFAKKLGNASERKVVVGGASAGFFMACLTAHHLQPPPLALLSITGIPTFRHPFFHSSTLITAQPIPRADIERSLHGPIIAGNAMEYEPESFSIDMLLPSSAGKNPSYTHPKPPVKKSVAEEDVDLRYGLYDYFVHENSFSDMLGEVDCGFEWAEGKSAKWLSWPRTIFIQGDMDTDVDKDVCVHTANSLGGKANMFMAKGQPHLFEATRFIEDNVPGMDVVRDATSELKNAVDEALARTT